MLNDDFKASVRVKLYEMFVARGRCPTKEEVALALHCSLSDVAAAYRELAAAHILVLQPDSGEVLMANPLSAIPTPFVVATYDKAVTRSWYGNCIWDGLGVIALLRADGRVLTSCACCGEGMTVNVRNGAVVSEPPGVVHFAIPARQWWDDIVFN
jgi:hypothetical protein